MSLFALFLIPAIPYYAGVIISIRKHKARYPTQIRGHVILAAAIFWPLGLSLDS